MLANTLFVTTLYPTLLLGWLAGAVANRAADHLPTGPLQQFFARFNLRTLPHYWTLWWYPGQWLRGQRGVCPHCGQVRPWRAPALEAAMIGVFWLTWRCFQHNPLLLAIGCFYALFLLIVLVIDYEQRRVLNKLLLPVSIVVLLLSLVPGTPTPVQALLGGLTGFGLFLFLALLRRGGMGAGDVKLAGVIGLMTGYPDVMTALTIGALLGGVAALVLLVSRRAGRKATMAYAPYLALGTLITLWAQMGIH
ncbi:MAG: A24 family peptidase [Caldilineaceae bacterium]